MNPVDRLVAELGESLRVRGRRRRRFLSECREHLLDSARVHGPDAAVRRFGLATQVARAFEVEVAVGRARLAAVVSAVGVAGVGWSTLEMVNAAHTGASAPIVWTVVFFVAAQTAAVATGLALLRAAAMAREVVTRAGVAGLCRRSWLGLGFALLTMFAAGAAVPGQAAVWRILLGPALVVVAAIALVRAHRLVRRHDEPSVHAIHPPVADLLILGGRPGAVRRWWARSLAALAPGVALAGMAAFWWYYRDEHGTLAGSGLTALIEVLCVLAGFVVLGPTLGLYGRTTTED